MIFNRDFLDNFHQSQTFTTTFSVFGGKLFHLGRCFWVSFHILTLVCWSSHRFGSSSIWKTVLWGASLRPAAPQHDAATPVLHTWDDVLGPESFPFSSKYTVEHYGRTVQLWFHVSKRWACLSPCLTLLWRLDYDTILSVSDGVFTRSFAVSEVDLHILPQKHVHFWGKGEPEAKNLGHTGSWTWTFTDERSKSYKIRNKLTNSSSGYQKVCWSWDGFWHISDLKEAKRKTNIQRKPQKLVK